MATAGPDAVGADGGNLAAAAGLAGATDLFVLRRLVDDRWTNVGGHGRGAGWAGNIVATTTGEPLLSDAVELGTVRWSRGVPGRVIGPYWSSAAALLRVDAHHVVVFGGAGVEPVADGDLHAAARRAVGAVSEVSLDKQQADDAEVAQAVDAVATIPAGGVDDVARRIAGAAAEALSCEFAAVVLAEHPPRIVLADEGWRPAATEDEIAAALVPLLAAARTDLVVEQDMAESPLSTRPFTIADGLVSRCAAGIGPDASLGVLVVAHAGSAPRGFTRLCQRVARAVAAASADRLADPHRRRSDGP